MPDPTDGFTASPDAIVHELGPIAALVWGVVWRYCQMGTGTCWASQSAIARRAGLCRETVGIHLRSLVAAGYLRDLTPGAQGQPHTYQDTGQGRAGDHGSQPESQPASTCRPTRQPPAGHSDTTCEADPQEGESQPDTKRALKRLHKRGAKETEQDTRGLRPRVRRDDQDPGEFDDQDPDQDYKLVAECLADFFWGLTGIPVPIPRNDTQVREARALWFAPLAQIARVTGSIRAGQSAIRAAIAILKGKGCIVKAPISVLGTALAVAGEQAKRRAAMQEAMERYGPERRRPP